MKFGFLIAGRDEDGLGHVSRSLGLASTLSSMGHEVCLTGTLGDLALQRVIASKIPHSDLPSLEVDVVVIDAIELEDEFSSWLIGSKKKLLVSPNFMKPELIDVVLSRVATPTVNAVVRAGGRAFIDPMYAFSGISEVEKSPLTGVKSRTVGIFISGAALYADANAILEGLAAVDSITRVILVGDEFVNYDGIQGLDIRQIGRTKNLWAVFRSIDFLITGDGITIFEGIARGIPTLSIYRDGALEKNRFFYEENWCAFLSANNLKSEAVAAVVSDLGWAMGTHRRLMKKDLRVFSDVMAKKIEEVARSGHEL